MWRLRPILAEAWRSPSVAERLEALTNVYCGGLRRLALIARPDSPAAELESYCRRIEETFVLPVDRDVLNSIEQTPPRPFDRADLDPEETGGHIQRDLP
jgi:hypothetical protein